ncbi:MAG: PadR family transcriptional regulator [Gemmatimonadota bacterium]|nr:PadR family transcriptional regulator [Gemmatimonadota bacterium]
MPKSTTETMDRELKRGTIELVILTLLSERERYGYEIVSTLEERSGDRLEVKDGTLYPVLYRLEDAGFVEPRWETRERGVPRKYYRLTEEGAEEHARLVERWREFSAAVESILSWGRSGE